MPGRRPWLDELAERCAMASHRAFEGGAGMTRIGDLEADVKRAAAAHGMELADVLRELVARAPRDLVDLVEAAE